MLTIMITISKHKGGVGKTTSNASIGTAILGKKVLLIDLDTQQNISFTLMQNEDLERSVYDALVKDKPFQLSI